MAIKVNALSPVGRVWRVADVVMMDFTPLMVLMWLWRSNGACACGRRRTLEQKSVTPVADASEVTL